MDWGFFAANPGDNKLLREETVYPSNKYYYFAMGEDVVFRFLWVLGLVLKKVRQEGEWWDDLGAGDLCASRGGHHRAAGGRGRPQV